MPRSVLSVTSSHMLNDTTYQKLRSGYSENQFTDGVCSYAFFHLAAGTILLIQNLKVQFPLWKDVRVADSIYKVCNNKIVVKQISSELLLRYILSISIEL